MTNFLRRFDSRRNTLPSLFNDNFFTDFFESNNFPAANVTENKNGFDIDLSVPGFDKSDIDIKVEDNVLTVSAKKENRMEEKDKDNRLIRQEFSASSFSRSFILPDNTDAEHISAKHKDGILNIHLNKMDKAIEDKVKKIEIG